MPPRGAAGGEARDLDPDRHRARETARPRAPSRSQESGESDVRVYDGQVVASTKTGDTIQLAANQALTVDAAGQARARR